MANEAVEDGQCAAAGEEVSDACHRFDRHVDRVAAPMRRLDWKRRKTPALPDRVSRPVSKILCGFDRSKTAVGWIRPAKAWCKVFRWGATSNSSITVADSFSSLFFPFSFCHVRGARDNSVRNEQFGPARDWRCDELYSLSLQRKSSATRPQARHDSAGSKTLRRTELQPSRDVTPETLTGLGLTLQREKPALADVRVATLERLVCDHQAGLRAFIRALGVREDWVDDLAQETVLVAYRKLDDWDPERDAGRWLRGIARHLAANERRKAGRRPRLLAGGLADLLIDRSEPEDATPVVEWLEAMSLLFARAAGRGQRVASVSICRR